MKKKDRMARRLRRAQEENAQEVLDHANMELAVLNYQQGFSRHLEFYDTQPLLGFCTLKRIEITTTHASLDI